MTTAFYATGTGVGSISNNPGSTDWATVRNAVSGSGTNVGTGYVEAAIDTGAANVKYCARYLCPIDTSALGSTATITGATLKIYTAGDAVHNFDAVVVATTPASNTAIAFSDYSAFGTTLQSNVVQMGAATDYTFTLNATGLLLINKTGYTQIGLRNNKYDIEAQSPDYYDYTTILFQSSKYITLTVTYTKPSSGGFLAFM